MDLWDLIVSQFKLFDGAMAVHWSIYLNDKTDQPFFDVACLMVFGTLALGFAIITDVMALRVVSGFLGCFAFLFAIIPTYKMVKG